MKHINKNGFAPIALILIIIGVLALGSGAYYIKNKTENKITEEIDISINEPTPIKNFNILPIPEFEEEERISQPENQEGNKAKDQIEFLTHSLQEKLLKMGQNDTSLIVAAIKEYEVEFNGYISTINQLNIETIEKNLLKSIRLAEWGNYKLYLTVKQQFAINAVASQTIIKTQKILDNYIKSQSIKSLDKIVVKTNKKSSTLFPNFISKVKETLVNTVKAEQLQGVIHKKVIVDPDNPGENRQLMLNCWSYESWVDLESGNIRQEQTLGNKECRTEINITEGATGRKIGLNPVDKLAEWIIPPKIGIGSEITSDPYTDFKNKLEQGKYILFKTDILNGQEVYVLRMTIPGPSDYAIIYLDATSYLPLLKLLYMEEGREESFINFGLQYVVGEIIKKESLPLDFFELKVPDGYELREWVPQG